MSSKQIETYWLRLFAYLFVTCRQVLSSALLPIYFSLFALYLCFPITTNASMQSKACLAFFSNKEVSHQKLKSLSLQLQKDVLEHEKMEAELKINPQGLQIVETLGQGTEGVVYKVIFQNKTYALKIIRNWVSDPWSAVAIQRTLQQLDLAPSILGIITKENLTSLSPEIINGQIGILMEFRKDYFLGKLFEDHEGEAPRAIWVTKEQKDSILQQARRGFEILEQLGILPNDPDAIISTDGHFYFNDFGFYEVVNSFTDPTRKEVVTQKSEEHIFTLLNRLLKTKPSENFQWTGSL